MMLATHVLQMLPQVTLKAYKSPQNKADRSNVSAPALTLPLFSKTERDHTELW